MKPTAIVCAALGLMGLAEVRADWASSTYGGYQPWYNMIAARNKCRGCDQARLQRFWHDYYRNLQCYYGMMENVDWVSYYKNHGTPIGCVQGNCGGPSSVQMAPINITPPIPWGITQNVNLPWSPPRVPWGNSH